MVRWVAAIGVWTALLGGGLSLAAAQQDDLEALRARLAGLGPTPEERLRAIDLTVEEREEVRLEVAGFRYRQRQGSADLIRRNRRDQLLAQWGERAIPQLVHTVQTKDAYWPMRVSAQALGILAERGEDARWLLYYHDAPGALIGCFDVGTDPEPDQDEPLEQQTGFLRELNQALTAISGGVAREGRGAWADWWTEEKRRFEDEQERVASERADLERRLEELEGTLRVR